MTIRSLSPIPALLLLAGAANAAPRAAEREFHYVYAFQGTEVGSSIAKVREDGTFEASGSIKLGAQIDAACSGKRKGDDYELLKTKTSSGAKTIETTYRDGKMTIGAAAPKVVPDAFHFSFLPIVDWGLDRKVDAAEAAGKKSLALFLFDSVAPINVEIGAVRVVKLASKSVRVRRLRFATLDMDLAFDEDHECVGLDVPVQGFRILAQGFEASFRDPFAAYPELSPVKYKTKTETVWVPMADGRRLRTDVVRPITDDKVPTIFIRTPYGRGVQTLSNAWYAARGYTVVSQDVRGRGESEGDWDPFVNETKDGNDALSWIATQPWSDGKVGMIGGSYLGYVQWAAAASHNPALRCIVPQVSPPMSAMRNLPYLYGAPLLMTNLWWLRVVEGREMDMSQLTAGLKNPETLKTLPLSKIDEAFFGHKNPTWQSWLARDRASAWKGWDFEDDLAKIDIPSLSISGYFDGDEIGTMLNWETRARAGKTNQWLVYGPWPHGFNASSKFGGIEFGESSVVELDPVYLRFFDTYLKEKPVGWEKTPRVKAFVTGRNAWIEGSSWPMNGSRAETTSLLPGFKLGGAGKEGKTTIVFDPAKVEIPAALKEEKLNLDGSLEVDAKELKAGLAFRTEPMARALTIGGPIELDLAFSTSAQSTDFFASIFDQGPNGKLTLIGLPGAVRASYRDGDAPIDLVPGRRYRTTVRLWDFVHEFSPGHRMVLLVTSNAFPMFARNLGTNEPIATATRMVVQKNTLFLGGKDGSVLRYRVLP